MVVAVVCFLESVLQWRTLEFRRPSTSTRPPECNTTFTLERGINTMKKNLFLGLFTAVVVVFSVMAATYPNKFVTNPDPEALPWTNTASIQVNGPFRLPNTVGAGNTSYDFINMGVGKTNALRWRTGLFGGNAVEFNDGTEGTYGSTNDLLVIHGQFYGYHAGNGAGLTNIAGATSYNTTNAPTANIGTPAMADKFVEFSTNGVLNITGIVVDPAQPATAVQYWRGLVLNNSGSTKTYTIASSFVCAGGGTLFNTNDATITIEYWPGLRTNLIFQCVR